MHSIIVEDITTELENKTKSLASLKKKTPETKPMEELKTPEQKKKGHMRTHSA